MLNRKIPFSDGFSSLEEGFNYLVKELNASKRFSTETTSDSTGLPVGSITHSMLTLSQFQDIAGTGWVLMDGGSASGSTYHAITGVTTLPDARGTILRGKSHGNGLNPDGDLALGTYTADKFGSHDHSGAEGGSYGQGYTSILYDYNAFHSNTGGTTGVLPNGGNETAPKSITVNIFIRIN
jgi:hypothetical protein